MMVRAYLALSLVVLVTACGQTQVSAVPEGPAVPSVADDTCGASQYVSLIGQDATALERVLIMGQVRLIRPDQAVTMDFSAERINFMIDANERIASITCG